MDQSPLQPTPVGAFRFNTDSSKLEYYDGNQWVNITSTSPEAQTGGTRGLFGGGCTTPGGANDLHVNTIDYVNLSTTGNAADFGDLTVRRDFLSSFASRTRGFWLTGVDPGTEGKNEVDYVTIASTGNAVDFGDLTYSTPIAHTNGAARGFSGCSDGNGGLG